MLLGSCLCQRLSVSVYAETHIAMDNKKATTNDMESIHSYKCGRREANFVKSEGEKREEN